MFPIISSAYGLKLERRIFDKMLMVNVNTLDGGQNFQKFLLGSHFTPHASY
jgi:hypothetical protein